MRSATVLIVFLLAASARAQITVDQQYEPFEPIVATLADPIPEGAEVNGGWTIAGAKFLKAGGQTVHIWAPPGKYTAAFSGLWIKTFPSTIDGKPVLILEAFGFIQQTADFTVAGQAPPDPPDPTPTPPGKRWGIIIEETNDRTPAQAALWTQLRDQYTLNRLLILDQDRAGAAQRYALAALDSKLPLPVLVVIAEGGSVVRVVSCPASVDGVAGALAK